MEFFLSLKKIILFILTTLLLSGGELSIPQSFTADFVQSVTNTKGKRIDYKGRVFYGDKRAKWIYSSPTQKEICRNGSNIIIVDHDLEQVNFLKIGKQWSLATILSGAKPYKKNIYTTVYDGKVYTVRKQKSNNKIDSVAYFDDLDNKVQILFKRVRYKSGQISKKNVYYKIPRGYDIIEE